MQPISSHALVEHYSWRYATKKFDPQRKIDPQLWATLEQVLVLTPSSYGLQPWRFVVVTNAELRARLRAASWNQAQITDASHLVVFARKTGLGPADVERYMQRIAALRNVPAESLEAYRGMILAAVSRPADVVDAWAARQVYIALGSFLSAAALLGVDACPMEGFDPQQYNELLGLTAQGYAATVLATAGYRQADDAYARLAKVRYPADHLIDRRD